MFNPTEKSSLLSVLESCLELDPDCPSGLRWIRSDKNIHNSRCEKPAGSKNYQGYYVITLLGKEYRCHQLVLLLNGIYPAEGQNEVDHIDRNPGNNLISNLRWTNRSGNIKNRNTNGVLGWRFTSPAPPSGKKAKAQYTHPVTKLKIHVGTFNTAHEAHLAAIAHRLENHWIN